MAVSKRLRFEIFRRDNHTCRYCGRSAPEVKLVPDHIVPIALGGRDEPSNLVTSCEDCNSGKSATPPDASLVEEVAADAVRWARARRAAAEQMLTELAERVAIREQFLNHWNSWTVNGEPLQLPSEWEATVDRFLAAGLPVPLLLDSIDIAMSRGVAAKSTFNYLCGVAWNRVKAIDEAAMRSIGSNIPDTPAENVRERDLLQELADVEDEETIEEMAEQARADGHPESHLAIEVAMRVLNQRAESDRAYHMALWELRLQLPEDLRTELNERVASLNIVENSYPHLVEAARLVSGEFALQYLRTLPQAEADDWITCASRIETEEKWILREAGALARRFKKEGRRPSYLCKMDGPNGTICPAAMTQKVFLANCRWCRNECIGHVGFCDEHLMKAIAGGLGWADGTAIQISDMQDYDRSDRWNF